MLRIHWGLVFEDADRFTMGCLRILFSFNYPIFIAGAAYAAGLFFPETELIGPALWLAVLWLVTFSFGTLKYIAWLIALLNRWPPLSGA